MSQQIQTMFSNIAPTYDQANHALSFNKDIQWRKDAVKQMLRDGFAPQRVLDLCAGTGDFALAVKEQIPTAQVVIADFAKPMRYFQEFLKRRGIVLIPVADMWAHLEALRHDN
jgi:demethylmenaquinone methyltransferase/2-methoxy-6-polyprenyl-1,4-benzoquinol methylase